MSRARNAPETPALQGIAALRRNALRLLRPTP